MSIRLTPEYLSTQLTELRERQPLVQCITNTVVTNFTANVLLALGASPAMADVPTEAGPFARIASGLLINLGTPHAEQCVAALEAADAATDSETPWVLDPVAVGALPVRTALAQRLRALRPPIIRGNASEIIALAGLGDGGRGVDSTDSADSALIAATLLAQETGGAVAVSGPVDLITDGSTVVRVANGSAYLTRITGGGCALGAVMAAFAGLGAPPLAAAVAATGVYTIAAEQAAGQAKGPGSFQLAFLDQLYQISDREVADRLVLS